VAYFLKRYFKAACRAPAYLRALKKVETELGLLTCSTFSGLVEAQLKMLLANESKWRNETTN